MNQSNLSGESDQHLVLSLPHVRLASGEYFKPVKVLHDRTTVTYEIVGVVEVRLAYIPSFIVEWHGIPKPRSNQPVIHFDIITTCNVNNVLAQYIIPPTVKCGKLFAGDLIQIMKISLHPQRQGLTRHYTFLEEYRIINSNEEPIEGQGLSSTCGVRNWWQLKDDETEAILKQIDFPSVAMNRLNYWFEQCVYITPLDLDSSIVQPPIMSVEQLNELPNRVNIQHLANMANVTVRATSTCVLIAVVICVRKAINFVSTSSNIPVRSVITVADNYGCCDVVLWKKSALLTQTNLQIGSLVLLRNFSIKIARIQPYAINHPQVPRIPIEISMEEGLYSKTIDCIIQLPQSYLEHFHLPDPFYNFVCISSVSSWVHNRLISITGIIVGLSRYHSRFTDQPGHIGRSFVRRWIDVLDVESGEIISVCAYVNRHLERHLAFRLNKIVCFTYLLVTSTNCLDGVELLYMKTTMNTEIFVVPGPGEDDLPLTIQQQVLKIKAKLSSKNLSQLMWVGGIHPFENYFLEASMYQELMETRRWSGEDLLSATGADSFNLEVDFVFNSRIAEVEICQISREVSWEVIDGNCMPKFDLVFETLWSRSSWTQDKTNLTAFYGEDQPHFFSTTFGIHSNCRGAAAVLEKCLRLPCTNISDFLKLKDSLPPDGTSLTASILNDAIYRITFEHVDGCTAVACLYFAEKIDDQIKLKNLLRYIFKPSRELWATSLFRPKLPTTPKVEVDVLDNEIFFPWIRMRCPERKKFEFQLCYLGK